MVSVTDAAGLMDSDFRLIFIIVMVMMDNFDDALTLENSALVIAYRLPASHPLSKPIWIEHMKLKLTPNSTHQNTVINYFRGDSQQCNRR